MPPSLEPTYSVATLCAQIRELAQEAFPSVWVTGEINRLRHHRSGHCYFELIEKGEGDDIVGKLDAVAWRSVYAQIRRLLAETDQSLTEGQQVRCRVQVDFYPPHGRLQLIVREIDPVFALGELARRRREVLRILSATGQLERNQALDLDPVPLRIGLVTSHESAAYHDFLSSLTDSGIGFRVSFVHAAVQGRRAESEVASALRLLARSPIDCAVVVRGGGSRSDLASFDSQQIAEAIAECPVPVITGLGHQIDLSIADMAAHTALKTPTQAAEFLVQRVGEAERTLIELRRRLADSARVRVRAGWESLGRARQGLMVARYRLQTARRTLEHLAQRLPLASRRACRAHRLRLAAIEQRLSAAPTPVVRSARRRNRELSRAIVASATTQLREWNAKVDGWERLFVELSPIRVLARGFSITRDDKGRVVVDPGAVGVGERIRSDLAGGTLTSRVEPS